MRNVSANTRKLTTLAMLAALAIVLVALIHFPLVPAAPFLEYDPADIPIFIGTFLFGPAAGLALTAVVCVIQGVTVSAASGPIGIIIADALLGETTPTMALAVAQSDAKKILIPVNRCESLVAGTMGRSLGELIEDAVQLALSALTE